MCFPSWQPDRLTKETGIIISRWSEAENENSWNLYLVERERPAIRKCLLPGERRSMDGSTVASGNFGLIERRKQQWFKTHPSSKLIRRETESESWLRHHLAISGAWCGSMHFLPLVIGSFGCWSPVTWQLVHFFTRMTFNPTTISFPCTIIPTSVTTKILFTHTLFTFHLHYLVIVSQNTLLKIQCKRKR